MKTCTETEYRTLNTAELDSTTIRELMGACIAPRPVALITTLGPGGIVNAAPFSNFMGVASDPPLIAFALGRRDGEEKDTLRNLRETGAFTVNTVSMEMAEAMHHTAADYPRHRSEIGPAGLSVLPGEAIEVPRIAQSPIHMECRLYQVVEIGNPAPTNALIIGHVLRLHVREDLMREGLTGEGPAIDAEGWDPLGGIGDAYMRPGETFELTYPTPSEE